MRPDERVSCGESLLLPGAVLSPAVRQRLSRLFRMDAAHVVQLAELPGEALSPLPEDSTLKAADDVSTMRSPRGSRRAESAVRSGGGATSYGTESELEAAFFAPVAEVQAPLARTASCMQDSTR